MASHHDWACEQACGGTPDDHDDTPRCEICGASGRDAEVKAFHDGETGDGGWFCADMAACDRRRGEAYEEQRAALEALGEGAGWLPGEDDSQIPW